MKFDERKRLATQAGISQPNFSQASSLRVSQALRSASVSVSKTILPTIPAGHDMGTANGGARQCLLNFKNTSLGHRTWTKILYLFLEKALLKRSANQFATDPSFSQFFFRGEIPTTHGIGRAWEDKLWVVTTSQEQ